MKKNGLIALSLILAAMLFTSNTVMIFRAYAPSTWQGYVKPSFPDYAQSGMPDFDEKQDAWNPLGFYSWCGPVAAADILWWLDSEYESVVYPNPVPPPTISDHFPLIPAFSTTFDDHDPLNVAPLVPVLASMMDTDGVRTGLGNHVGTILGDLINGIQTYLAIQGLSRIFEVHNMSYPTFTWIDSETEKCQGVILFLEFYSFSGGTWYPFTSDPSLEAGHYVAVAGANASLAQLLISDPYKNNYEMGTDPLGRQPVVPLLHNPSVHNDTQYVSQDGYNVTQWVGPPPPQYPAGVTVYELMNYLKYSGYADPSLHTFIRAAVATSPIPVTEWPGYIKPAYPDYAPSGMPDFDEKQAGWNATGAFTWCVPVAVADSLWWLDSKYESIFNSTPVAPPTISDHFNLVTSYNSSQWDDHSPSNLDPFVRNLASLMDTDGMSSGIPHLGTLYNDIQPGIEKYLKQQGVSAMFEVHNASYANFTWIDSETQKCQDVELCLEFWYLSPGGWENYTSNPDLNHGHCVTCAGSNSTTSQVLISDPYLDSYEAGNTPGRSPVPEAYPHSAAAHNDTRYVSQDAYNVTSFTFPPMPPRPTGYPQTVWELQNYSQVAGLGAGWHAFIRGAIATSPIEVHDIAVTNLTSPKTIICQYYTGNVTTTVANNGNLPETFNLTVYANMTAFFNGTATSNLTSIIQFQNVALDVGKTVNLTSKWNTCIPYRFPKGNYTLIACAAPLPGETHLDDNNYTDGFIIISMNGDVAGAGGWPDGQVEGRDITMVALRYGTSTSSPNWSPNYDINDDGQIEGRDITLVALQYGKHDDPYP